MSLTLFFSCRRPSEISAYRRLFEFSANRRPSEYLLPTSFIFLFYCWRPFEISAYRWLFEISAYRRPSADLPTSLKKNAKKIDVFPIFFDISAYRSLFEISAYRRPSEDLPTSFEKKIWKKYLPYCTICLILRQYEEILSKFLPTDVLPRFPPTDVLPRTSRRLFKKSLKKICIPLYILPKFESIWKKSKLAYSRSSVDHQTHKGFDISKNFWCHRSVHLGEQPPEVSGDLKQLLFSSAIILLLLLTINFERVAVWVILPDICDDQRGRGVADEIVGQFKTYGGRLSEISANRCLFKISNNRCPT